MNTSTIILIIVLIVLLSISAFFSSSETALTSANVMKLRALSKDSDSKLEKAKLVYKMQKNFTKYLTTILVGNNIVNILASSLTTMVFISLFNESAVVYATIVMTVLVLVFGEVLPKTFAANAPEKVAVATAKPLYVIGIIMRPITYLFDILQKAVNKIAKSQNNNSKYSFTEQELHDLVMLIENEGGLDQDERELIESAIEFADVKISEIMVSKQDIIAININDSNQKITRIFSNTKHSRLPLMDANNKEIIGVVLEKDYLMNIVLKNNKSLEEIANVPMTLSKEMNTIDVLEELQRKKNHMAIVVDDKTAETIGIVTLEDILEVLVGEIYDETDDLPADVIEIGLHNFEVSGQTEVQLLFDMYLDATKMPENAKGLKVADWVKNIMKVPKVYEGMKTVYENLDINISQVKDGRIIKVEIEELTPKDEFFE
ncbi:hemolysin family protein [Mycoplasma sp. P36-A1]|uniref:hemolysin family protein n=1 Tax=Mycoplasma sp. P36-A1 TaxID=3252900 RepID=UPI003C2ABD22